MSSTARRESSPRRDSRTSTATVRTADNSKQQQKQQQQQQQQQQNGGSGSESPRSKTSTKKRSPNKIYRTPPTPAPEEFHVLERSFTLDCIAVNTTSNDYAKAKPKLGQVTRPYNAQKDKAAEPYFAFNGVARTLKKNGQEYPGTSIEGPVVDQFFESGAGYRYLSLRNKNGAGHSRETIDGHGHFMTGMQPVIGYNGQFGYRRTNPWLRQVPSPFGVATNSPIY